MNNRLSFKNRKADMGIGFLIVFLALITVAAIAAGVLLTTSQNLQQKALLTGSRTRAEVSTLVRTITLYAENGLTNNLTYFCSKMALGPGSDPISFSDMLIEFDTDTSSSDKIYGVDVSSDIDNTGFVDLGIDIDGDGVDDSAMLTNSTNITSGTPTTHILFNISNSSNPEYAWVALIDGTANLSGASSSAPIYFNVFDATINYSATAIGTVSIVGRTETADTIPASTNLAHIFISDSARSGAFSVIYRINGSSHAAGFLVRGDVALVCFAGPNPIAPDKDFAIRFIPKIGHVSLIDTASPDAYTNEREYLFP